MTVIISKHREYHARAMKEPNFETMTPGYNFSYPVLNTIEIGSLFIVGGSRDIQIERMGKTTWSFDIEKSELTIKKDKSEEKHYIVDPKELYKEMSKYWKKNASALEERNNLTAEKRAETSLGNQNAKKDRAVEGCVKQEEAEIVETYEPNPFENTYGEAYKETKIVSPSRNSGRYGRSDYLD